MNDIQKRSTYTSVISISWLIGSAIDTIKYNFIIKREIYNLMVDVVWQKIFEFAKQY